MKGTARLGFVGGLMLWPWLLGGACGSYESRRDGGPTGGSQSDGAGEGNAGDGADQSADLGGDSSGSGGSRPGGSGGSSSDDDGLGGASGTGGIAPAEPNSCLLDEECLSGSCRISYRDRDGDLYGDESEVTGRCDGSIPVGYAALSGDCCDDGGVLELAASIHPGQEAFFDEPALICGIAWDYDCSGKVEYGGYTCANSDEACADPTQRNYEAEVAYASSYVKNCGEKAGASCGSDAGSCTAAATQLTEADCASWHPLVGCSCSGGCGQGGCTTCTTVGGSSRRVVECH